MKKPRFEFIAVVSMNSTMSSGFSSSIRYQKKLTGNLNAGMDGGIFLNLPPLYYQEYFLSPYARYSYPVKGFRPFLEASYDIAIPYSSNGEKKSSNTRKSVLGIRQRLETSIGLTTPKILNRLDLEVQYKWQAGYERALRTINYPVPDGWIYRYRRGYVASIRFYI